jgi:hypothetical protein
MLCSSSRTSNTIDHDGAPNNFSPVAPCSNSDVLDLTITFFRLSEMVAVAGKKMTRSELVGILQAAHIAVS